MKILITGASGIIGRVLMKGLVKKHDVIGIDKISSETIIGLDVLKEQEKLKTLLIGVEVVIHLAWDIHEGGVAIDTVLPENKTMTEVMYALALQCNVKKFIFASSVHVSFGHINYRPQSIVADHQILHHKQISVQDEFFPLGVYGASKVYLEALGKAYSQKGIDVVSVRFGNVTPDDGFGEYPFWLSHRDCVHFIDCCVEAKNLPAYNTFFAISNNPCNPFDLSEATIKLGYKPQDSSPCPIAT